MKERSSFLFAKNAEPLLLVFLFVLLPLARARLAGDGDNAGGQGLCPAGCWRALGAGGHLVFIGGDGRGDGLDPCVHFLLDKGSQMKLRRDRLKTPSLHLPKHRPSISWKAWEQCI